MPRIYANISQANSIQELVVLGGEVSSSRNNLTSPYISPVI
ncbi:hypothetical protein L917_02131 [Phytophthora nicotianae]|uniref:Uncharacterized protein n=3 Tax=Phytophthora nicotianae TaxID=4792 RepID=W2QQZ2_PHYN3|nr:hypothetical protein PPTG_22035 [Phytophthora nicotianae INRA-310]ETM01263.1 hypothetical protein L917_02131 [Phytophthora nicotianae]ETN14919.1 hypothetical protein PPTG_22035 [Phytophthora nicotianae INRA-310]ETO83693.1 hypothetical protein F444_02332 [Phytophthora nicotianae P1976]